MPYKYVSESVSLYLRIYATLSGFMGSIYGDGIGISVGHGVTLLLLLCPSCLSFAKTNKIKLNCLKIAKNETKCQRGATGKRLWSGQIDGVGVEKLFPLAFPFLQIFPLPIFGWENTQLIRENSTQAPWPRSRIKVFLARNWILSGGSNGDKRICVGRGFEYFFSQQNIYY